METAKRQRRAKTFQDTVLRGKTLAGPRGLVLVKTEDGRTLVSLRASLDKAGIPAHIGNMFATRLRHRSVGPDKKYTVFRVDHNKVRLCATKAESIRVLGLLGKELVGSMDTGTIFDLKSLIETIGSLSLPPGRPKSVKPTPEQKQLALDFQTPAPAPVPEAVKPTPVKLKASEVPATKLNWLHDRYKALAQKAPSLTMTEVAICLRVRPSDLMAGLEEEGLLTRGKRGLYQAADTPLAKKVFVNPGEVNPRIAPAHLEHFEMLQYSWKLIPEW